MIVGMKKLTLACTKSTSERLCRELVFSEAVECRDAFSEDTPTDVAKYPRQDLDRATERAEKICSAIELLSPFGSGKRKKIRPQIYSKGEFERLSGVVEEATRISERASELSMKISELCGLVAKAESDIASVKPYIALDEPLSLDGTKHTVLVKGEFPKPVSREKIETALDESGIDCCLSCLSETASCFRVACVTMRSDKKTLTSVLSRFGFSEVPPSPSDRTPGEETVYLRKKIAAYESQKTLCREESAMLAKKLPLLGEASDYLASVVETERLRSYLYSTKSACLLCGFVPTDKLDELEAVLEKFDCAYTLDEPSANEKIPIKLKNNRFSEPFESVLGMYSYPDYHGIDPTAVMSAFYFIIFGMIMQDVLYGLLLLVGGRVLIRALRLKPGTSLYKTVDMFSICGISTMVFGVLFGGCFGDLPRAVATNMLGVESFPNLALVLNPVTNPMPYLVISLALGGVHLVSGMIMKAYMLVRRGKPLDAFFDVGIWLVFFVGIGLLFCSASVGKWVAIIAVAGLILTQGRAEKSIIMKLLKGILSLYDIVNYVSDLLSYSRIMALGLSGAIIAQVVNIVGTLGGATFMGFVVLVPALVLGHLLNLALSLLGAFVHTARLQYIEFLGKFYEDGGEEFKPSKIKTKYTEITKEAK